MLTFVFRTMCALISKFVAYRYEKSRKLTPFGCLCSFVIMVSQFPCIRSDRLPCWIAVRINKLSTGRSGKLDAVARFTPLEVGLTPICHWEELGQN